MYLTEEDLTMGPQDNTENQGASTSASKKKKIIQDDRLDKAFKILESAGAGNNECHSFGQFVGNKLQGYNQHVRNVVQYEISNILFKADYGYFNQQQTAYQNIHYNPSPSTYNYNPQSYPTMQSSSIPYSLTTLSTTSVPPTPTATNTQTFTPATSPVSTHTSEELDFSSDYSDVIQ